MKITGNRVRERAKYFRVFWRIRVYPSTDRIRIPSMRCVCTVDMYFHSIIWADENTLIGITEYLLIEQRYFH